jgi:hypothetical protein
VGQVGVLVAGVVLTDGASLAAEGAAVAGEGAVLLGEGATILGEGMAVASEGAAVASEGAVILSEGAASVAEGTALAGEGTAVAGEGTALASEGSAVVGEGAADAEAAAAGSSGTGVVEKPTYVPNPETPVPQGPGGAPTEFPPDPTLYPQPPGPAPDIMPGEPNPFEPYNPGQPAMNPNIPRPPRLPDIVPEPTKLPPGGSFAPGMETAAEEATLAGEETTAAAESSSAGGAPPSDPPPPNSSGGGGGPDGPPDLTPEQQRQVEILQEFEERQVHHGGQQMEVADEAPAPNLEEPDRIPELTQGPEPDLRLAKTREVNFSQADVSQAMGDGTPIQEVEQNMADHGWDPTRPDADMVANEDGSLTSIDNRRLVAADGAGVEEVPAQVHAADEPLPEEMADRFQLKKPLKDPVTGETIPKGTNAETWGEAAKYRAANQGGEFPLEGSPRAPDIRVPNPNAPPAATAPPTLEERAAEALRQLQDSNPAAKQALDEFETAEAAREAELAIRVGGAG